MTTKLEFERSRLLKSNQLNGHRLFTDYKPNTGGQEQFFNALPFHSKADSPFRWILLRGGIGSGKSWTGAAWFCSRALLFPEARGLITANDYPQLETSTLVALAECCETYNIPLWPKEGSADDTARAIAHRRSCKIGDASILVISASKFGGNTTKSKQSGRGLQTRYIWLDEGAYADKTAFETLNGRLGRGRGEMKGVGVITTTPNKNQPYNWCYENFDDPQRDDEKVRIFKSFVCDTRQNTFLGNDYVDSLEASYSKELAEIELRGGYTSLSTGKTYKYFSRDRNVLSGQDAFDFGYNRNEAIHISLDFNWNPACAVAAHQRGKELFFVKEFRLANSDTFELADAICKWLVQNNHQAKIYIHGDATGNSRSANSKKTNWEIVWDAIKKQQLKPQASRKYANVNPNVLDTVLAANNLLSSERIFFCLDKVPNLIKDLEQVIWDKTETQIDKSNVEITHLSDCMRYLINGTFPYERQQDHAKVKQVAVRGLSS